MSKFYVPLNYGLRGVEMEFSAFPELIAYIEYQNEELGTVLRLDVEIVPTTNIEGPRFIYYIKGNTFETALGLVTDEGLVRLVIDANEVPSIYAYGEQYDPLTLSELGTILSQGRGRRTPISNATLEVDGTGFYLKKSNPRSGASGVFAKNIIFADDVNSFSFGFKVANPNASGGTHFSGSVSSAQDGTATTLASLSLEGHTAVFNGVDGATGSLTIPTLTAPVAAYDLWEVTVERIDDQLADTIDVNGYIWPLDPTQLNGQTIQLGSTTDLAANVNDTIVGDISGTEGIIVYGTGGGPGDTVVYIAITSGHTDKFVAGETLTINGIPTVEFVAVPYYGVSVNAATPGTTGWSQRTGTNLGMGLASGSSLGSERLIGWFYDTEGVERRELTPVIFPSIGPCNGPCTIAEWDMELASKYAVLNSEENLGEELQAAISVSVVGGTGLDWSGTPGNPNEIGLRFTGPDGPSVTVVAILDDNTVLVDNTSWAGLPNTTDITALTTSDWILNGADQGAIGFTYAVDDYGMDDNPAVPWNTDMVGDGLSPATSGTWTTDAGAIEPIVVSDTEHAVGIEVFNNALANVRFIPTSLIIEVIDTEGYEGVATAGLPNPTDDLGAPFANPWDTFTLGAISVALGTDVGVVPYYQQDATTLNPSDGVVQDILQSGGGVILPWDTSFSGEIPIGIAGQQTIMEDGDAQDRDVVYAAIARGLSVNNPPAIASALVGALSNTHYFRYTTFTVRCRLQGLAVSAL